MSRFERLLERVIAELPDEFREFLKEVPVIVESEATREMLLDAGYTEEDELLGGVPHRQRFFVRRIETQLAKIAQARALQI